MNDQSLTRELVLAVIALVNSGLAMFFAYLAQREQLRLSMRAHPAIEAYEDKVRALLRNGHDKQAQAAQYPAPPAPSLPPTVPPPPPGPVPQ